MTIFRSLVEALHEGYEVLGSIEGGYLVRLTQNDGGASFGIVMLKQKLERARSMPLTIDRAFESNTAVHRQVEACLADFTLCFHDGVPIVKVKGDIDVNNVAAFEAVVECATMTDASAIVVALMMTEYVCERAYDTLSELQARLERVDRFLCISCDPNSRPRRTIPLLAVPIPIFNHVDDAIAALRHTPRSA